MTINNFQLVDPHASRNLPALVWEKKLHILAWLMKCISRNSDCSLLRFHKLFISHITDVSLTQLDFGWFNRF
jgi:hypothetical protein